MSAAAVSLLQLCCSTQSTVPDGSSPYSISPVSVPAGIP